MQTDRLSFSVMENDMTSFKRFFFAAAGLSLLPLLLVIAATWLSDPMDYMDYDYPYWTWQKNHARGHGETREVLFLGDSMLRAAVLPDRLGKNVYNLALGGGTPTEMYYSLLAYLEGHPAPLAVFVSFGSVHYADIESYRTRNFYFHYLPWYEAIESQKNILLMDEVPLREWPKMIGEDIEYLLRLPTKYFQTLRTSRLGRGAANRDMYSTVEKARGHRFFGTGEGGDWVQGYKPYKMITVPFRPLPSQEFYMKKLLALCTDRSIPVKVIQEPIHSLDYALIKKSGYLRDYQDFLRKISRATGVDVETDIPVYSPELFGDFMHVNMKGAVRYTDDFRQKYFKK